MTVLARSTLIAIIYMCLSQSGWAASLSLEIRGATKEQSRNIKAHLGEVPESQKHVSSYVFNAEKATKNALAAIGFYHPGIHIALNKEKKPWVLVIEVEAGPEMRWNRINFNVEGAASEMAVFDTILPSHQLLTGNPIQHSQYDGAKEDLIATALQYGFFDGTLETSRLEIDRQANQANVNISYKSGPRYQFGAIKFRGTDLKPQLLNSMLPFQPQEPYKVDLISDLNRSLVQSGYFDSVKIIPQIEKRENQQVPVNIDLIPAKKHIFDVGVGYATDTEARASVTWRTPKVNKYGHSQETKIEYSQVNPFVRFLYNIPLSHPNNDILQLGAGLESNDYADIDSHLRHLQVGRKTVNKGWVRQYYLRYLDERWDIYGEQFKSQFLMPGISLSKTLRRGPVTDPTSGFRQLFKFEFGSTQLQSESDIVRTIIQFKWLKRFRDNHRIVMRAHGGASYFEDKQLSDVPPSLRFYAGGDESLRGFAYQSLGPSVNYTDREGNEQKLIVGGRYLAVGSLEYQYYLTDKWRLATFTDFGNAFDELEFDVDPAYSLGAGVHWISIIGPIKVEFARSISRQKPGWRLHINIGAEL